jgi:hypothetical protein
MKERNKNFEKKKQSFQNLIYRWRHFNIEISELPFDMEREERGTVCSEVCPISRSECDSVWAQNNATV